MLLPLPSFADPEKTFTEEQLQEQFQAYRTEHAGSGLDFEDRGMHELKGIEGEQRLYSVT